MWHTVPEARIGQTDCHCMLVLNLTWHQLFHRAARLCHSAAHGGQTLAPWDMVQPVLKAWAGLDLELSAQHKGAKPRLSGNDRKSCFGASVHPLPTLLQAYTTFALLCMLLKHSCLSSLHSVIDMDMVTLPGKICA